MSRRGVRYTAGLFMALLLSACGDSGAPAWQGYAEGEFVHIASAQAGRLDRLLVRRGDTVTAGAPLFALEAKSESAALMQAQRELEVAQAQLADLQTGQRPAELAVVRAQLAQAETAAGEAAQDLQRDRAQFAEGAIARAQLERREAAAASSLARLQEMRQRLEVARLPGRERQREALRARVEAAQAQLAQAQWRFDEKSQRAPRAAAVVDTLYREGEWVSAGAPIVRLLPPEALKIIFFVPERQLATLRIGQEVRLSCDACPQPLAATVRFIAAEAEYTPPLIYSNETRAKLVFRVEAGVEPALAAHLHPGLPVTVTP